jgi:hypothetical protein
MNPVYQDQVGKDGRCEQAALASLLGLPLHQVPGYDAPTFADQYREFLRRRGFVLVFLDGTAIVDCYYLAFGTSIDNGHEHCCVYRDGRLVHDPHPGHHGLGFIEEICVLIPQEIDIGPWRNQARPRTSGL